MHGSVTKSKTFRRVIRSYYREHGRDLPWRRTKNPYRILVSEMMLQQTQVERVEGYYPRFLKQFPDFEALAEAPLADVLAAWQGLGYNRRALFLKKLAHAVMEKYDGALPQEPDILKTLPGVGAATAAAVAAFAFDTATPFLETNIRRVFIHFFFPKKRRVSDGEIRMLVSATLDRKNPREWYYALMDYGAMLGRREKENPNRRSRHYTRQSRFEGSDRQVRARMVRLFLAHENLTPRGIAGRLGEPAGRIQKILTTLEKEEFIVKSKSGFKIR